MYSYLYCSLLYHVTLTSEVGVSYVVHMNDDASEVNSFSYVYYQALSSPCFEGRA